MRYKRLHVIMDIQHAGKPSRPWDRGASHDLNKDGVISSNEQEANLTPLYVKGVREAAEYHKDSAPLPVLVSTLLMGEYPSRQRQANSIAKQNPEDMHIYVACHLNIGSDKSLIIHDGRSSLGKKAAEYVAGTMRELFHMYGYPIKALAYELPDKRQQKQWQRNAQYTINGIYKGPSNITGLCFEPLSLDVHSHLMDAQHLEAIGEALYFGFTDYMRSLT